MSNAACQCGSSKAFVDCCEPFIQGRSIPQTAEQLMRSRFTAFSLQAFQYLIDTHHPSQHKPSDLSELQSSSKNTIWFKLIIHHTERGLAADNDGVVEFSAFFNDNGVFFELREASSFIKENDRWLYVCGEPEIKPINLKIQRNARCWCNSGKKFKKCHALL